MSESLLKRAEAIRAAGKLAESVRGSGFHDDDRDPVAVHRFTAPQRNGLPRASEHLVPFYDHFDLEEVHFVGPDAGKALAALQSHHARIVETMKSAEARGQSPWDLLTAEQRRLYVRVPKMAPYESGGQPRLTVRLHEWNLVVEALYAEGVGLSGAPLVPDGSTP